MMDEINRVLKPEGTVWVNLGDTYNGNKEGNTSNKGYKDGETIDSFYKKRDSQINDKCLLLIPHRFAIGCIDRGWIVRNDIIWAKRNGMPESVTDRFSKKHEYFFFMTKSTKYYFDLDAVREKCKPLNRWGGQKLVAKGKSNWDEYTGQESYRNRDMQPNNAMKNPGSVSDFWDIPTKPSSVDHYATYNDSLLKKPVLAGCPEGGIIYDPFMGSGTTAAVAIRAKRNFIGSEAGKNYFDDATKLVESMLMSPTLF